jgi:monovalent cation:H+ antiporter-2, CPA2 family
MPHDIELIATLAGGLGMALLFGLITQRARLSPIVGYLFAGVVVGPFTPGFVADASMAEQLAEFGVVLLMFGVGLHFHLRDLLAVWKIALPGALVQIAVATGLGTLVTSLFGWTLAAGIVFGLAVSVASTVVLVRVLADHDALQTPSGHLAVGWLVIEDIFTVLVLVVLPTTVAALSGGEGNTAVATAIGTSLARIAVFVLLLFWLGGRVIPLLLGYVARTRSRELFTLSVLVVALGVSVASAKLFGVSMALGAFLTGMIVGRSELSARAASEALPMRDAFAVLFFVSVGMLVDPRALLDNVWLIAATIAVVVIGKSLAAFAVVRLMGGPATTAATVAAALAQIGEFSFILAASGRELGILPVVATQVLVVTAIATITFNPLVFRSAQRLGKFLTPEAEAVAPPSSSQREAPTHRAVVVGYGPVGQTVTRLLREEQVEVTVIELNLDTVRALRESGRRAVYGDAAQLPVLEAAGVDQVRTLIFSASGTPSEAAIAGARGLNPQLRILTRASYISDAPAAQAAGADVVVAEEAEVALAMTEQLLADLGATPEQLDRARERARARLSGAQRSVDWFPGPAS